MLDTSIPMQIGQMAGQMQKPFDPVEAFTRATSLKALMQQNQAGEMELQQKQQAQQEMQKLNALYQGAMTPSGDVNSKSLISGMASAGIGSRIPEMQKKLLDAKKVQADMDNSAAQAKLHIAQADKIGLEKIISTTDQVRKVHGAVWDAYAEMIAKGVPPQDAMARIEPVRRQSVASLQGLVPDDKFQQEMETPFDPAKWESDYKLSVGLDNFAKNRQAHLSAEEAARHNRATEDNARASTAISAGHLQVSRQRELRESRQAAADGTVPLSAGDRTKLREGSIKLNDLQSALNNYRDVLGKVGTRIVPGKDTAEVQAAYVNLMTLAKEAYNLGVLQGGDFALMEKSIKDPTGIMGNITGKPALINQLSQLDKLVADKRRNLNDAYSGKPLQSVQSNAPQSSSGAIGGGRTVNTQGGVKFLGFE